MKKLYSNKLVILSLILPGLLLFLFAILAPIVLSIYYGFTDNTPTVTFRFKYLTFLNHYFEQVSRFTKPVK